MEYIRLAGFAGVFQCDNRRIDDAMISALVERWRPETNTFHMPFGEVTVTLQNVQVLWGLQVDGQVICGNDRAFTENKIKEMFNSLTGITLEDRAINRQKINLPYVSKKLTESNFPYNPNADADERLQRARTIIFLLVGTTLFPGTASNLLDVKYLSYLNDLSTCVSLSWGSAVLAFMYRHLSRSTSADTPEIGGPMFLLQLWAFERLPCTRPKLHMQLDYNQSYGARWQESSLSYKDTASHVLSAFLSKFNSLSESSFIWLPYDDVLWQLPEMCLNG
ncbi:serine/threonine-protein phosphatase 7 long form homolog [Bidens hawaiensis]|uniref:serine/threonine-protein phosphatase 7 long form homolog n=1 Tax=Bidens hawaiensis TaxID=980011 RepID=UPI004049C15F